MRNQSLCCVIAAVFASGTIAGTTAAQGLREDIWQPEGAVYAAAIQGNILYVGGSFQSAHLSLGVLAAFEAGTGRILSRGPALAGAQVAAAVPDGAGGWYIGGYGIGGNRSIAHMLADRSLASWDPQLQGTVTAMAISGDTLYVGGDFSSAGGKARQHLAAYNLLTGHVTPWNPSASSSSGFPEIRAMLVSRGTVYVGGLFSSIDFAPRSNIAAVDAATGQATGWAPDASGRVSALMEVDGRICAAGEFASIGGALRGSIALIDSVSGAATSWTADADGPVLSVSRIGSSIIAGGTFNTIRGLPRGHLAAIDASTGQVRPWQPVEPDSVVRLGSDGTHVFLLTRGGSPSHIASVDAISGQTLWRFNTSVVPTLLSLAVSQSAIFVGGVTSLDSDFRGNLAAIDLVTGEPTPWSPNSSDIVRSLAVAGDRLLVAGDFTSISGQPRNRVAAVDLVTGQPTSWDPNANESVRTLAVDAAGTVYAGGDFSTIGGAPRGFVAALDSSTGIATAWRSDADDWVNSLSVAGTSIYAGGWFTSMHGQPRAHVAAMSIAGGALTSWNPGANGNVDCLLTDGERMYLGGEFTNVGGAARRCLAAVDILTGITTSWDPGQWFDICNGVYALAARNGAIVAGGDFIASRVADIPSSSGISEFDPTSGSRTTWLPGDSLSNRGTRTLLRAPDLVIAGGMPRGSDASTTSLAVIADESVLDAPVGASQTGPRMLAQNRPNPVRGETTIPFLLPRDARVWLTISDLQGRAVLNPLAGELLMKGRHEVHIGASRLSAGLYWYKLEVDGHTEHGRMVVLW